MKTILMRASDISAGGARSRIDKDQRQRSSTKFCQGAIALLLLFAIPMLAQDGLKDVVYTAGTTTRDGSRQWAYLLWQASSPNLLTGKKFAVYAKAGPADSASLYERKAIVARQTDPTIISLLLGRAASLGENLPELDCALSNLFQKLMPPGSLTLPQKLSAVIRGATGDADLDNNLALLAGLHPGVQLCLGTAHAEMIPGAGKTTFELREFDAARGGDLGVIGRVTVEADAPTVLPAPGAPVQVPEFPATNSAKGHLNVKLRWATPDPLRRVSLLNYGFNVYRLPKTLAEARRYHLPNPPTAALLTLARSDPNGQVNRLPVLKSKDFDAFTVLDFNPISGDTNTFFIADDNRRFDLGGVPFNDGDQFYYFVTARDLLGRDGLVSDGTLVTICKRMPPLAPKRLKVENEYFLDTTSGAYKQSLKITWQQNTNPAPDVTASYHVYRWSSPREMQETEANPALDVTVYRIATLAYVPNQLTLSYVDNGPGAPALPADAGRTFWYSVRAADNSVCGPNFSGNSAPAFGVLRHRAGPEAPQGYVQIRCARPVVVFDHRTEVQAPANGFARFRLIDQRLDSGIAWAEFYAFDTTASNYLGRTEFLDFTSITVTNEFNLPLSDPRALSSIDFFCRVGSHSGKVSQFALAPGITPNSSAVIELIFTAYTEVTSVNVSQSSPPPPDCNSHQIALPGDTTKVPICVCFTLKPPAKEWRLYRRVDGGPLTMIRQDLTNVIAPVTLCIKDDGMPFTAGDLCYYVQALDEEGNASPLAIMGCVNAVNTNNLPVPLLAVIDRSGTASSPAMQLRWFCQPHGVERFQITRRAPDGTETITTARIGPALGSGPMFTNTLPVTNGVKYLVSVQAVAADGPRGKPSNTNLFLWSPAPTGGTAVPWPERPLPPVAISFAPGIRAERLSNEVFAGIGVRIGEVAGLANYHGVQASERLVGGVMTPYRVADRPVNPLTLLYTNKSGGNIFPLALYRCQVTNANFPAVSGDVTQVSPMMESIAHSVTGGGLNIYDPFIALAPLEPGIVEPVGIYLVDTQPVIGGARYRYLLVRFQPDHEIAEVITTNEVEVTP